MGSTPTARTRQLQTPSIFTRSTRGALASRRTRRRRTLLSMRSSRIRIHSPHLQKLFSTKPSRCRARARDVVLHADQLRFLHAHVTCACACTCACTCTCTCACACTCLCNVTLTVGDVPPSHAHRPARDRVHCAHVHKLCSYIRAKLDLEVLAEK